MRQLKFHEQKLLKKVDFLTWKKEDNPRETQVMRKYHIQNRQDYVLYNRLCGSVKKVAHRIALLPKEDKFRHKASQQLLDKLEAMGIIQVKKSLAQCDQLTVSSFCRRRLPVIMVRYQMAQNVKDAVKLVEQGHVRVGPQKITDPAFMVTK